MFSDPLIFRLLIGAGWRQGQRKSTSTTAKPAAEQFKQEHTCGELKALFVLSLTPLMFDRIVESKSTGTLRGQLYFFKEMPEQEVVGGGGGTPQHNRSAAEHSLNDLRRSSLLVFV